MDSDVKLRQRDATTVLSRRASVGLRDIGPTLGSAFGEAYGYLARIGLAATEEPFVIYRGMPGPEGQPFEIEVCVPIPAPVDPPEGWGLVHLPAGTFASVLHVGPYDGLRSAYARLETWMAAEGYTAMDAPREVYLSDPGTPEDRIRTVVEFPVARAAIVAGDPAPGGRG